LLHPTWFIVSSSPFGLYQPWYFQKKAKKREIEELHIIKKKLIIKRRLLQQEIEATKAKIEYLTTGCTVQQYKVYRPPRTPEERE